MSGEDEIDAHWFDLPEHVQGALMRAGEKAASDGQPRIDDILPRRLSSVWMWGYAYEVPPSSRVYKTREACEQAVRDEEPAIQEVYDGQIPTYIWIREFEVVE